MGLVLSNLNPLELQYDLAPFFKDRKIKIIFTGDAVEFLGCAGCSSVEALWSHVRIIIIVVDPLTLDTGAAFTLSKLGRVAEGIMNHLVLVAVIFVPGTGPPPTPPQTWSMHGRKALHPQGPVYCPPSMPNLL